MRKKYLLNKKILFVTTDIAPIYHIVSYLSLKNNVFVIFLYDSSSIYVNKLMTDNVSLIKVINDDKFSFTGIKTNVDFIKGLYIIKKMFFIILNTLRKNDFDIINSHWIIPSSFLVSFIIKIFTYDTLHIETARGSDINIYYKKNFFYRICITYALSNSDLIIALSKSLKNKIYKICNKRCIYVVPGGVDINMFYKNNDFSIRQILYLNDDDFLLVYVGYLIKIKRVEEVIKYVRKLNNMSLHFLIVGDGPEKDVLLSYLGDNIHFMDWIKYSMVPKLLNNSDALILYSESEGLPTILQEAMACGIPTIGSNIPGIKEIIQNNFNGFIISNINQLGDVILYLKDDENKKRISKNAIHTAITRYSNDYVVTKYEKLFLCCDHNGRC